MITLSLENQLWFACLSNLNKNILLKISQEYVAWAGP